MHVIWRSLRFIMVLAIGLGAVVEVFLLWPALDHGLLIVFLLAMPFGLALALDGVWHQNRQLRRSKPEIKRLVREHYPALSRNLDKAIVRNDYGAIVQDNRPEVLGEFLASVEVLEHMGAKVPNSIVFDAGKVVLSEVEAIRHERIDQGFDPTVLPVDGIEFEHWVAEAFQKFGWAAKPTVSTGDQGIDVIVEKDGHRIGVQTKLYSKPVGNKSVQEAVAGKSFYCLDGAAVLSNAEFTPSARSLAAANKVVLMSQYDIPRADELFGISTTKNVTNRPDAGPKPDRRQPASLRRARR